MGACCSGLGPARDTIHLIFIGLDDAGKTSVLNMVQQKPDPPPDYGIPDAITFNYSEFVDFRVFDLRGKTTARPLWPMFLADAHGMVFVVDAANLQRIKEAEEALHSLMRNACASGKYLLILANKQDLPGACSVEEITLHLALDQYPAETWRVQTCTAVVPDEQAKSAVTRDMAIMGAMVPDIVSSIKTAQFEGPAVEGFDWLVDAIMDDWEELEASLAVQRLKNPFAQLVPAEHVPDWRRESVFSRVARSASLGSKVSWGATSARRLSSASFSSRRSAQRRRRASRSTRDASPAQEARRARKSASIAGSSRRGSDASHVSRVSRTSRTSVRFKGAGTSSSSSSTSPPPKDTTELSKDMTSEKESSASMHPISPLNESRGLISAVEVLHGTNLSEEEAVAAVKRLWDQLGLLWPDDVEERCVETVHRKPEARKSARKSFTAFASGVVASSSLAGAAATSSLAAGAARTGKVWTGWAGAKTKGVGASMRHTISKMGLGLFKQSVSSSDDIDGGSENKIVEYDSIREGSQESQSYESQSADHSSLYEERLSQHNQAVKPQSNPKAVVHAWLAQPRLPRADSAEEVPDDSIAGSEHAEAQEHANDAAAREEFHQHSTVHETVQVLLDSNEDGWVKVQIKLKMIVKPVSIDPRCASTKDRIRVTLAVTTEATVMSNLVQDSRQQEFVQLQLHFDKGKEDISALEPCGVHGLLGELLASTLKFGLNSENKLASLPEDKNDSISVDTVPDDVVSIEHSSTGKPDLDSVSQPSAAELVEHVGGGDDSVQITAAQLDKKFVRFNIATQKV